MTLADRKVVMNGGCADQIGTPLDVYANPATEFVAGFIGSPPTNFMKAELASISAPDAVTLGVRPEHLEIADAEARLRGSVLSSEALGAETLVHLELPDTTIVTVRQSASDTLLPDGTSVGLRWSDHHQMLFDRAGRRCQQS